MAISPSKSMTASPCGVESRLHGALLVDEILTRLPAAAAVRFQTVCRAWYEALTSDHFVAAQATRAAAARQPEIIFFPPAEGSSTSLYTCSLPSDGEGSLPTAARELLTLRELAAEYVVLSRKPCRGLTLVREARSSGYYVCNLSTGDHVALPLPPCEPAKASDYLSAGGRFLPLHTPWIPFEFSSAGLGFDPTTSEYKAVRLSLISPKQGQPKCEVYTMGSSGGWRPCAGDVPMDVHGYFLAGMPPVTVNGSFYWLLRTYVGFENPPILSFSVGAEQFGRVQMPPGLPERVRHLAELDGSLCAVVHGIHHRPWDKTNVDRVIEVLAWSGGGATSSWSTRCRIELDTLPRPISEELDRENLTIIPLCTTAGGNILLATGRHKVFAYDAERNSVRKVFSMQDYVDIPVCHSEARLLINIFIHEEHAVRVPRPPAGSAGARLHVKLGGDTVGRREKHRSENYGYYSSAEHWWKMTEWTPALRNCLPTVMNLEY